MAPTRVILMSCGSYNPPTNMHLRMFEIARDHLHRMGTHIVVGAVISPTHDNYAKKELASSDHRCAMLKLATQNSDWIRVSTWETRQNGWTKTRPCLQHHQNTLNSVLLDTNDINHRFETDETDWIPENVKNSGDRTPIQIKLLCGADLLESFGTPGLWEDEDIDAIVGQHGLVVITREGSNPNKFIYDSDILSKYMHNIHIVTEWIPNEVSSTKIRRALKRGESVRYLVQDTVIDYIYKHGIYDAKTVSTIKLELSSKNDNDYLSIRPKYESTFLTPSPSDVTMTTPSPVEIISIDITETVLKKNFQNSPTHARPNFSNTTDDNERIREKFNTVITDNVNKILTSNKVAYPGQAKQIIANESGESEIFCEVGLSCISENYKVEMEIDGKVSHNADNEDCPLNNPDNIDIGKSEDRVAILNDLSNDDNPEQLKYSEKTTTPEDSESKISVILSFDVIDTSSHETRHKCLKHEMNVTSIEPMNDECTKDHRVNNADESKVTSCDVKLSIDENNEENEASFVNVEEKSATIIESLSTREEAESPENLNLPKDEYCENLTKRKVPSIDEFTEYSEKSILSINERDSSDRDSIIDEISSKRDGNVEIDGKYIKSVVNSRKSPKKVINDDIPNSNANGSESSEIKIEESINDRNDIDETSSLVGPEASTDLTGKIAKSVERKRGVIFQGSLDSINVKQPKSSLTINNHDHPTIKKKSKSYEFIKITEVQPTIICKIPITGLEDENLTNSCDDGSRIKTDSNSIFVTANEPAQEIVQNDEFCSVCCYTNEPSSTEAFYTLRSNGSSPIEEASTECDICSNCDLREDPVKEISEKVEAVLPVEPVCELCEICGDVAMDEDVVASSRPEKDDFVDRRMLGSRSLPLSLPKGKKSVLRLSSRIVGNMENEDEEEDDVDDFDHFEIDSSGMSRKIIDSRDSVTILHGKTNDQQSTDDTNSNDDEFEIENCGLDLEFDVDNGNEQNSRYRNEIEDTLRNIVPRDEISMSGKNMKKITRAGSLINRNTIDRTRSKRRYSSVDNLQNSRKIVISKMEKQNSLSSRGIVKGLVASADNIRPVRNSRDRTTLGRSADDVGRGYHSSMDDTRESPLYENIGRKKFSPKEEQQQQQQQKPRDSGTIKMILTKHGIKIISDKETAL